MSRAMLFIASISFLGCLTTRSIAQDSRWGSPDDPTVKFIIAIEAKWANSNCSPQPDLKSAIADDFQGTATDGHRYDKAEAIATDLRWSRATVSSVRLRCDSSETPMPLPWSRKRHPQGGRRQGGKAIPGVD